MDRSRWLDYLEIEKALNDKGLEVSRTTLMQTLGVGDGEARVAAFALKHKDIIAGDNHTPLSNKLATENRELRIQLSKTQTDLTRLVEQIEIFDKVTSADITPPEWLTPERAGKDVAIASAMLSDVHYDEVVKPEQVEWTNGYCQVTSELRLQKFFESLVKLGRDYCTGVNVEGLVLALVGDMVSGIIHDELRENNEGQILPACFQLSEVIAAGINLLVKQYGNVSVKCVVGNHGRLQQKVQHKNRVHDNFDWVVYKALQIHFAGDKNVTIEISDSSDMTWEIYNTRYRLTHGDSFRGGNGIAGIFSPLMRGDHKKRTRSTSIKMPYDVLLLGHFHQLLDMGKIVCNGSVKGYDEYAYNNNFDFEQPRQAFWLTDPKHGKTGFFPVFCSSNDEPWRDGL